jgi:glycosyltransferase involved in cell wall biosynthesis
VNRRKPAYIADYDLSMPLSDLLDQLGSLGEYDKAWIILRYGGLPVSIVEAAADKASVETEISKAAAGLDHPYAREQPDTESVGGTTRSLPSITVVICTRERPTDLARALSSLAVQTHKDFKVLVVDNAPTTPATRRVTAEYADRFASLSYAREERPGLSNARNCALRLLDTELVAWLDDDETADARWLAEILEAFASYPDAAAVTGSVVPGELETWPQWWFEKYGGHTKGRGFSTVVFFQGDTGDEDPLYPLPPFGVGANMAFRIAALLDIGGFDRALGAGTATYGAEDTLAFSQLLLLKHTVVYQPSALTKHFHRRTLAELEKQMYGYGVGLTAFYVALLRWNWRLIFPLARLVPRALRDMLDRQNSSITEGIPPDFPTRLLRLKRRGMFLGPAAYLKARRGIEQ